MSITENDGRRIAGALESIAFTGRRLLVIAEALIKNLGVELPEEKAAEVPQAPTQHPLSWTQTNVPMGTPMPPELRAGGVPEGATPPMLGTPAPVGQQLTGHVNMVSAPLLQFNPEGRIPEGATPPRGFTPTPPQG